jgi:hypothetical protein
MKLVFRKFPAGEAPPPAAGEVHLRPHRPEHGDRRDLAALVHEGGPDVLPRGPGEVEVVVVDATGTAPTLDELLAATFAMRLLAGDPLPDGCKAFARYAALVREGLKPGDVPLEVSLEGVYLAIRSAAGADLTDPEAGSKFAADWSRMAARILEAAATGQDPFTTSLFSAGHEFARERAFLARDREAYLHDVARGEQWLVDIPAGPPRRAALFLREPRSVLFKFWSRREPVPAVGEPHLFLAVHWGNGNWVFSTDPVHRLPIKSLAEVLQAAEAGRDAARAARDPWFDGKPFGHTLVAAPHTGTQLAPEEVLPIVRRWARARRLGGRRLPWPAALSAAACLVAVAGLTWGLRGWMSRPLQPIASEDEGLRGFRADRPTDPASRGVGNGERPNLFLLDVGVSVYEDPRYKLDYASNDADDVAAAFKRQKGLAFAEVYLQELTDKNATRQAVVNALARLPAQHIAQHDLVVVTVSGHGANTDNGDYYFLPYDYHNEPASAVYWDDFKRPLTSLPCPVLVVMDTCHSGTITQTGLRRADSEGEVRQAVKRGVDRFSDGQRGVIVMAACLSRQAAHEKQDWKHGALTLALLECLTGRRLCAKIKLALPQEQGTKDVSLKDLDNYVTYRVRELVGGEQAVVSNQTGNIALQDILISRVPGEQEPGGP